jgi:hypothetical protein
LGNQGPQGVKLLSSPRQLLGLRSGMGGHQGSPSSGLGAVSYSSSDEETSASVSGSSTSSSAPVSPGAVVSRALSCRSRAGRSEGSRR